jgi:transcriptional regulator with XRE-family HTH domain
MGKGTSQTQPLGSPHEVGRRIREVRDFDMTQAEFAERIGISQNYLSTTEHGTVEIRVRSCFGISREFGKSVEWLLTGGRVGS